MCKMCINSKIFTVCVMLKSGPNNKDIYQEALKARCSIVLSFKGLLRAIGIKILLAGKKELIGNLII